MNDLFDLFYIYHSCFVVWTEQDIQLNISFGDAWLHLTLSPSLWQSLRSNGPIYRSTLELIISINVLNWARLLTFNNINYMEFSSSSEQLARFGMISTFAANNIYDSYSVINIHLFLTGWI